MVTGTIIAVIGISLMRVGINWIFGNPVGPTAPALVDPAYAKWLAEVTSPGSSIPAVPKGFAIMPTVPNPKYADLSGFGVAALVLVSILLIVKYAKGFIANISVLLGIVIGAVVASITGHHDLREGGQGRVGRHRAALSLRHAAVRPDPDLDDDPHHDRGDDRIDRHVPRAR